MTLPLKHTPLLDLALLGKDMAKDLSTVKPCLLHDLVHPLIVLSDLQRAEIQSILKEGEK